MNIQYYPEETESGIADLIDISRKFGADPDFVLAGGGNSSYKNGDYLHVKASGVPLATITGEGLVEMSISRLNTIWNKKYPVDPDDREAKVLQDLLLARMNPADTRRPSVETLLHLLFPYRLVVHTHPARVNGLTCALQGEERARHIFGDSALWIPVVDPGYILACAVKSAVEQHRARTGIFPKLILLQNHGVFVAADRPSEICKIYQQLFEKLDREISHVPQGETRFPQHESVPECVSIIQTATRGTHCLPFINQDISLYITDRKSFEDLSLSVTPDHIVYCGYRPLFVENPKQIAKDIAYFIQKEGFSPHIIAVAGVAVFACHTSERKAEFSRKLFEDNVKIAVYTRSFGGIRSMPEENINFIRHWEVEKHRFSQIG